MKRGKYLTPFHYSLRYITDECTRRVEKPPKDPASEESKPEGDKID